MEKYSNVATQKKSLTSLVNTYNELNNKLYKSEAEQQKLNSAIQDMSDLTGIDAVADSYGNLSINIGMVREELNKLYDEQQKLLKELTTAEHEGLEKLSSFWHQASQEEIDQYYDGVITENRSKYRALMSGIKDDLTDETRGISTSLYQEIQSVFKERLLNEVTGEDTRKYYDQSGIAQSVETIEKQFNEALDPED